MCVLSIALLLLVLGVGVGGPAGVGADFSDRAAVPVNLSTHREPGAADKPLASGEDREREDQRWSVEAAGEASSVREVVVSGSSYGSTESEAQEAATAVAERNMVIALQELARELAGRSLSDQKARLEWAWLLKQPGVEQQVTRTCTSRALGPRATVELRLSLPQDVLTAWTRRLEQQAMLALQSRLFGGIASVLLTLAALLTILILDRRTGGYHRVLVVSSVSAVFGLLLTAIWVLLLWAF